MLFHAIVLKIEWCSVIFFFFFLNTAREACPTFGANICINLALQAKRIYSGSLWQNYCQMHPNPNPTFQKNVKKDGYF